MVIITFKANKLSVDKRAFEMAKFPPQELDRLLHLLEVLIVRYQLICGGRTGRLEISCANLAVRIYKGDIQTVTEALGLLKDVLPADREFREAFATKQERAGRRTTCSRY